MTRKTREMRLLGVRFDDAREAIHQVAARAGYTHSYDHWDRELRLNIIFRTGRTKSGLNRTRYGQKLTVRLTRMRVGSFVELASEPAFPDRLAGELDFDLGEGVRVMKLFATALMDRLPDTWSVRGEPDTRADRIHELSHDDDYDHDDDNLTNRLYDRMYRRYRGHGWLSDLDPEEYDLWLRWY